MIYKALLLILITYGINTQSMVPNTHASHDKNDTLITPLIQAVMEDDTHLIQKLLENKANINEKNKHGLSALMFAAAKGSLHITKQLITHKAKIHATNIHGTTALDLARAHSHPAVQIVLLKAGARRSSKL